MSNRFEFGPFLFDAQRRLLLKNGTSVEVGQKCLILLGTLLRAEGQVVSKSDLMDAAWQTLNIEESNLSVQIAALRKCLGKSENGGEWIRTVQRIGYQFIKP
jgi:DNA-binding winged helix-turn-helix (wHTH) protein